MRRRVPYLGELPRDAAQIAGEYFHAVGIAMQLRADAVVLVLHPDRLRRVFFQPLPYRLRARFRAGEHALDRREEPKGRRAKRVLRGERRRFADVAQHHVGLLHLLQVPPEGRRYPFFHEPFLQADAEVAREYFHQMPAFRRREPPEGFREEIGLCQRPPALPQRREELPGRQERKFAGLRLSPQNFERRLSGVAMAVGDRAKLLLADSAHGEKRALHDRPAGLQRFAVRLGESPSRQVNRGDGQVFPRERPEVIAKEFGLLQLAGRRRDLFAHRYELQEFRVARQILRRERADAVCPRGDWQAQFELVILAQGPRFDSARAEIPRKGGGEPVQG